MSGDGTTVHEATLDSDVYYVVCEDVHENRGTFRIYP